MGRIASALGVGTIVIAIACGAWWWQLSGATRAAGKSPQSIARQVEQGPAVTPILSPREPDSGAASANLISVQPQESSAVNHLDGSVFQRTKDRYRLLTLEKDPVAKREIRLQISGLQHTKESIDFLAQNYAGADADGKLQLQSIFAQINPAGLQNELELIAVDTKDEILFLSIVYSLRNLSDVPSKKAMLSLAGTNFIPASREGSFSNQAAVGLYRVFLDSVRSDDLYWLRIAIASGQLNVLQQRMVADAISKLIESAHLPYK